MRFKVTRRAESEANEWNLSKKQYERRKIYAVVLEALDGPPSNPPGTAGRVELTGLSAANAAIFEIGAEVWVDFRKATAVAGQPAELPESARPGLGDEMAKLREELAAARKMNEEMADRIAKQSDLLGKRAEGALPPDFEKEVRAVILTEHDYHDTVVMKYGELPSFRRGFADGAGAYGAGSFGVYIQSDLESFEDEGLTKEEVRILEEEFTKPMPPPPSPEMEEFTLDEEGEEVAV